MIIEKSIGGKDFKFKATFEHDPDCSPLDDDGHGAVSDWVTRDKKPGELVLCRDGSYKRYYHYQSACQLALVDKWNAYPYNEGSETPRQQAAKAAMADFKFLKSWFEDEWGYVVVCVTLLDDEGEETDVREYLGGVQTLGDYHLEEARILADELLGGYGVSWSESEKKTYTYSHDR